MGKRKRRLHNPKFAIKNAAIRALANKFKGTIEATVENVTEVMEDLKERIPNALTKLVNVEEPTVTETPPEEVTETVTEEVVETPNKKKTTTRKTTTRTTSRRKPRATKNKKVS